MNDAFNKPEEQLHEAFRLSPDAAQLLTKETVKRQLHFLTANLNQGSGNDDPMRHVLLLSPKAPNPSARKELGVDLESVFLDLLKTELDKESYRCTEDILRVRD